MHSLSRGFRKAIKSGHMAHICERKQHTKSRTQTLVLVLVYINNVLNKE